MPVSRFRFAIMVLCAALSSLFCLAEEEPLPEFTAARAVFDYAMAALRSGDSGTARAHLDSLVAEHEASDDPGVADVVLRALYIGIRLPGDDEKTPGAVIAACDRFLDRQPDLNDPEYLGWVGAALLTRAMSLSTLEDADGERETYRRIIDIYGSHPYPAFALAAAQAMVNLAILLNEDGRRDDTLALCAEVWNTFGEAETPQIVYCVGWSMTKAAELIFQDMAAGKGPDGDYASGLAAEFGNIALRHQNATDAESRPGVIHMLFAQMKLLTISGQYEEAIAVADAIDAAYGNDSGGETRPFWRMP